MRGLLAAGAFRALPRRRRRRPAQRPFKKVKPKSLQVFSRQFATMIEAGVSVVAALVTLEPHTGENECLADVIADAALQCRGPASSSSRALAPAPEGLQPPVSSRDGRGRRVAGTPRLGARPDRHADREGDADQAPCQGRDGLPDSRDGFRDPRPHFPCCYPLHAFPSSSRCSTTPQRGTAEAHADRHDPPRTCSGTGGS